MARRTNLRALSDDLTYGPTALTAGSPNRKHVNRDAVPEASPHAGESVLDAGGTNPDAGEPYPNVGGPDPDGE